MLRERVRQRRILLGLSQQDLAEAAHVSQAQISRYEKGENSPTGQPLTDLASALETTPDWLLGLTDDPARPIHDSSDLSELEREALRIFRSKTPDKQRQAVEILKAV
jgi:transcriptional regulator with XRE-family HTH domain